LLAILITQSDASNLREGLQSIGWFIVPIALFHLIPLYFHMLGWRQIIEKALRPPWARLFVLRWITESVNNLLPVAQVGGEIVRAHLLTKQGIGGAAASSTVLVDFTIGLFAQTVFTLVGLMLLINATGSSDFTVNLSVGVMLFLLLLTGFYFLQSRGLSKIASYIATRSATHDRWHTIIKSSDEFTTKVKQLYQQRQRIFLAFNWRLLAWFAGAGETFLILYALGINVPLSYLVILESFAFAARSLGFLVPGAVGITEGVLVLVGTLLGLTPAQALTLALAKRARELLLGIPGLVVWFAEESPFE